MSQANRSHIMWVQPDVLGLFSVSVSSFSDNVGLSALIFSDNVGTKGRCYRAEPFIFSGRYIYRSETPVMTAIGHETDVTIADLVADVRASVPMDAGARLGESWVKAAEQIDTIEGNMIARFRTACRELDTKLTMYGDNFVSAFAKTLSESRTHGESSQETLMRCFRDVLRRMRSIETDFGYNNERFANRLEIERRALDTREHTLLREAGHFFTRVETALASHEDQFDHSSTRFRRYLYSLKDDIAGYEIQIERQAKRWYVALRKKIIDCEQVLLALTLKLKQGYSIVKDKAGKVLKSKKSVAIDDIIQVELSDGVLDSAVKGIQ